jgi:SAM-dependent methyltransferase
LHEYLGAEFFPAVCDIACGAGHFGLSFAGKAGRIIGVDPAANMLRAMEKQSAERGVVVETVNARAEALPFESGTFDLTLCRLAAHHFSDVARAVGEMQRVARDGGRVAIIDLAGPATAAEEALNHDIELLHDPTHVRSYTIAEWRELFESAGLVIEYCEPVQHEFPAGLSVKRWCEISSSGMAAENKIREKLRRADTGQLRALGIHRDGDEFLLGIPTMLMVGRNQSGE